MKLALLSALTAVTLALPARAEDPKPAFTGCSGELAISGQSNTTTGHTERTVKQISGGAGCAQPAGNLIIGGGARLNTGSGDRSVSIIGKAGIPINDGLMAYGLTTYTVDAEKRIDVKNGVLAAGAGVEFVVSKNVTGFMELQKDIAKTDGARALDEQYTARAGVRIYLGK
jgi:opacity protein-like surface antigen